MDKRLSDFDKVMSCLLEPLGDYAPKRRYLLLDYNDSSGADLHWPRVASVWRKGVERRAAPGVPVRPFFGRATSATVTNKSVRNRPVSGRLASGPKGGANFVPLQMGG